MKTPLKLLQTTSRSIFLSIFWAAILSTASYAFDEPSETDCQCRAPGGDMKNLGTVECVNITGRQYLVRCEMSMNTPYWNKLDDVEGCPLT